MGTRSSRGSICLRIRKGEVVAIVGPSGAGKSTLVDLVPRFYDPTAGVDHPRRPSISGRSTSRSLRDKIGIVTQETILFNDTVRNNIAYGLDDCPIERVIAAAQAANAHNFIDDMPHGYDSVIGERGVKISGGERQRLALARAILKNPPILILDEATSALDTESEILVQEAIERLMAGRTSIVIAHRLSTVQHADRIVVLEAGRVVETGKHGDLLGSKTACIASCTPCSSGFESLLKTNAPMPSTQVPAPSRIHLYVRSLMFGAMYLFLTSAFFSIALNSLSLGLMGVTLITLMVLERRLIVRPTPLDWFFLAWVLAEFIAMAFSPKPLQALEYAKRLLLIGIVYWFATWITTDIRAARVMAVLLGTAALVALIGVWLMVADRPLRLGIFQFYMTTSELMMFAGLLLLPFIIHPATPRPYRWLALAGLVPVLISLYGTVTKGAYLGFAAGVVFIALVRSWKLIVPLAALTLLLVLFAPPFVQERLSGIVDIHHPENQERLMLWKTGLRMFEASPVVGYGDIDLHDSYVRFMDPGDPARHGHLHDVALQILVTLGAVGFAAVAALFVRIFATEWRIYRRVREHWLRGSVALGALAVFVSLQIAGLTEWTFGDQEIVIVFWISLGMALAVGDMPPAAQEA